MEQTQNNFANLLSGLQGASQPSAPSKTGAFGFDLSKLGGTTDANAMPANTVLPEQTEDMSNMPSDEELMNQLNQIDSKKQSLDQQNIGIDQKFKDFKDEILKNLIYTLESVGVDTSSIYSIQQFLDQLATKNPDMQLYVESLLGLLTGQAPQIETNPNPQGEMVSSGNPLANMDINNSTDQSGIMGAASLPTDLQNNTESSAETGVENTNIPSLPAEPIVQ